MIFRFSDCVLDLDRRLLLRDGTEQHIEPQVFDLLAFLVQSDGRTVTKDALVEHIWDGRAISDDAITSRIKSARKAIGDDGRAQRFIRTLPRVGYRFDGSVEPLGKPERSSSSEISQNEPARRGLNEAKPLQVGDMTAPEIGYIKDRKGRSIGYAVHGEGPLVVLPPFWVTASDLWHDHPDIREFYLTLGQGLRILRYDRPGSGLSRDAPPNETLDDEVALLEDMVAAFEADRVRILAISAAGAVSIRYAVRHPDSVERICFYGAYS